MKKVYFLLSVCALFLSSCVNDEGNQVQTPQQAKQERDLYLIRQMGYDVSDIRQAEDGYIVEGDIWLTQRHLDEFDQAKQTRHSFNWEDQEVSKDRQTINITVSGWRYNNDVARAMDYWNAVANCNITFATNGSGSINLTEEYDSDPSKLLLVNPPSFGNPGNIIVNMNCSYLPDPGTDQALGMIVHAIGHSIGFGHTNVRIGENVEEGFYWLPGTETADPKSIMTKETNPLSWTGISQSDIVAFNIKYPKDKPEPEPEPDFATMEWIKDSGMAINFKSSNFDSGTVNVPQQIVYTGSRWSADGLDKDNVPKGMRIVAIKGGNETVKFQGDAGSYKFEDGTYRVDYGAAVKQDGRYVCYYNSTQVKVTPKGLSIEIPILTVEGEIDISREMIMRCVYTTDDPAWQSFKATASLTYVQTGAKVTLQQSNSVTWRFKFPMRGTYRAQVTISNGTSTKSVEKTFTIQPLGSNDAIYYKMNRRTVEYERFWQYYLDFYSDEGCSKKVATLHSTECHFILWQNYYDHDGFFVSGVKQYDQKVMIPPGVYTYNLPYTIQAIEYLTLDGYRWEYEIVGLEYK